MTKGNFIANVRFLTNRIERAAQELAEIFPWSVVEHDGAGEHIKLIMEYQKGKIVAYTDMLHEVVTHFAPKEGDDV